MSAPYLPKFDRFAQVTFGLVVEDVTNSIVPQGVGLVTRFLNAENWVGPTMIVTSWTNCPSAITPWSACGATITTIWQGCS